MTHDRPTEPTGDTTPPSVNILVNGAPREVPPGTTIAQLLAQLEVPRRGVAVEVNLQLVPRDRHEAHLLREADRLEVVTLVGGG